MKPVRFGASGVGLWTVGAIASLLLVTACSLLDRPTQCSTDADCARFGSEGAGAMCNIRESICVASSSTNAASTNEPTESIASDPVAETPSSLPAECLVSPKPSTPIALGDAGAELNAPLMLGCETDWTLDGALVVGGGATLTIAAGTTIRAKKGTNASIVVKPGGRIIAEGQANAPIVMTVDDPAPKAGDWRGLFVLGNAPRTGADPYHGDPLLQHGGNDPNDASGKLTFVRIEYPRDGLFAGSVGKGTTIDHVQVRRSNDNCFAIWGGTFDAKHLVCQQAVDEQFEVQQGYVGRLQFLFGQKVSPGDGHNGMLVDGNTTSPVIYNATFCGQNKGENVGGHALVFRNGAKLDANNAILTGWLSGIDAQSGNLGTPIVVRSSASYDNALGPVSDETGGGGALDDDDNGFDEVALFERGGNVSTSAGLIDCHDATAPKPWPNAPLATGAQTPPADGFFDAAATFVGAFKDANDGWMTGWTRFDAQ